MPVEIAVRASLRTLIGSSAMQLMDSNSFRLGGDASVILCVVMLFMHAPLGIDAIVLLDHAWQLLGAINFAI